MKFKLEIEMDNAAFDENPMIEAGNILSQLGAGMDQGYFADITAGAIADSNGKTCGSWKVTGKANR